MSEQVVTMAQGGTGHVAVPGAAMREAPTGTSADGPRVAPSGRPVRNAIGPTIWISCRLMSSGMWLRCSGKALTISWRSLALASSSSGTSPPRQ